MTERFPDDNHIQCAWDDYVEAKARVDLSMSLKDAITAGHLWRRFLQLFEAAPVRLIDNNVVPFDFGEDDLRRRLSSHDG